MFIKEQKKNTQFFLYLLLQGIYPNLDLPCNRHKE